MSYRRMGARALAPLRALTSVGNRMRPSYLVVGTKRGGSTALGDWVNRHPEVAPCRAGKGTHYFDVNYTRGPSWYYSRFERPRRQWKVTGEASPYYMFHPLSVARIKETLPEARLILVLREPAQRAWSQFRRETDMGHEQLGFAEALAAEEERLRGEVDRILADPGYQSQAHRYHTYRTRGRYAEQLRHIYSLFDPDQVLVLQSEALFADPNAELDKVWSFLGLSSVHLDGLRPMKASVADLQAPAEVLAELRRYYAPLNEELYSLPGVGFRWHEQEAS